MTVEPLKFSYDPDTGIANLTFNRPDVLNAIDVAMAEAFAKAVDTLCTLEHLRCVHLEGAGRCFMAGGDVDFLAGPSDHAKRAIDALLEPLNPAIDKLFKLDAPVLASVRGIAAGAGLSFVAMADIVVAHEDAKFMAAYEKLGTVPDCGGTWFLPRKIGAARATELIMTSRMLNANEAQQWGIVTKIASDGTFEDETNRLLDQLSKGPTRAFGAFRELLHVQLGSDLRDHLEGERQAFRRMTETRDFAEGCASFLEKRSVVFKGT